jgi:hypothetical protein
MLFEQAASPNALVREVFRGSKSMMMVDTDRYDRICNLYHEAIRSSPGKFPTELLRLYFHFAVAIVHELARVAHFARFGTPFIPFEGNGISENGFDWENVVFGGLPHEHHYILCEWLCKDTNPTNFGKTYVRDMEGGSIKYWDFPIDFILRFFRTDFWEDTVKQKGAEALKVSKDVEYTVTRDRYRGDDDDCEKASSLRDLLAEGWSGPISRLATKMRQPLRKAKQKRGSRKRRKTHPTLLFRVKKPRPTWLQSRISISRLAEFIQLSYDSDLWDLEATLR